MEIAWSCVRSASSVPSISSIRGKNQYGFLLRCINRLPWNCILLSVKRSFRIHYSSHRKLQCRQQGYGLTTMMQCFSCEKLQYNYTIHPICYIFHSFIRYSSLLHDRLAPFVAGYAGSIALRWNRNRFIFHGRGTIVEHIPMGC